MTKKHPEIHLDSINKFGLKAEYIKSLRDNVKKHKEFISTYCELISLNQISIKENEDEIERLRNNFFKNLFNKLKVQSKIQKLQAENLKRREQINEYQEYVYEESIFILALEKQAGVPPHVFDN
ncbi:hypothetical protein HPT25_26755 [Bacillus sp. BRMEA1]|uniref:hypothetical protein n=1 Tax=Neobacillus endophyticus TaxID=2738405 RepID=UPI0015636AD4|nr:hypothetical protein [Neobacillus endophyticus]NRD80929.1 hypothetical protein [Neobacillus endophyticus]